MILIFFLKVKVTQEENEIKLVLIGKGEYMLKPEYSHLKQRKFFIGEKRQYREKQFKKNSNILQLIP